MQTVGCDLGNGYVKVIGDNILRFPSVGAYLSDSEIVPDFDYLLEWNGERMYIGQAVLDAKLTHMESAYGKDQTKTRMYQRIFLAAMGAIAKETELEVCMGLPVDQFKSNADALDYLIGSYSILLNHKEKQFEITGITPVPQPVGTYILVRDSYPHLMDLFGIILDFGFYTTDFLLVNKDKVLPESDSLSCGMSEVMIPVKDYIKQQTGIQCSIHEASHKLLNGFTHELKRREINEDVIEPHIQRLFQNVITAIQQEYPRYAEADYIIATGGGAVLMRKYLEQLSDQVFIVNDSQVANAKGFKIMLEAGL